MDSVLLVVEQPHADVRERCPLPTVAEGGGACEDGEHRWGRLRVGWVSNPGRRRLQVVVLEPLQYRRALFRGEAVLQ